MNKKDYLLKLLALLETDDLIISGLTTLISQWEIDEKIINHFIEIFQAYEQTLKDKAAKEKVQKGIAFLEKMKAYEVQTVQEDTIRLAELDTLLESI